MKLPCMQQGCKERYTLEQIQEFCSTKIQQQYNVIKEDVRVGKSSKLKWCARPGCEEVITRPRCCKRKALCKCGFATCWKCGDPYHEANCQRSGKAELVLHNMNPRVSNCPSCSSPIYKISGCNHMTCYRCNSDWCWICRRVTKDYHGHFSPGSIFGCAMMMEIPQSVILWTILLLIQLIGTPFILVGNFSYRLGGCLSGLNSRDEVSMPARLFFFGVFGLPIVLIPVVIMLPIVIIYRLYVIVILLLRSFCFCCCC